MPPFIAVYSTLHSSVESSHTHTLILAVFHAVALPLSLLSISLSLVGFFPIILFSGRCLQPLFMLRAVSRVALSLLLGWHTNTPGQHYSEPLPLSLRQQSHRSSTTLSSAELRSSSSALCMVRTGHTPAYTHTHTHTCVHLQTSHRGAPVCPCVLHFFLFSSFFFSFAGLCVLALTCASVSFDAFIISARILILFRSCLFGEILDEPHHQHSREKKLQLIPSFYSSFNQF